MTKDYPSWSPYPFAMNRPIDGVDLDGLEWKSQHKWSDQVTDKHLKNAYQNNDDPDAWKKHRGETYKQLWAARVPAILDRREGKVVDCANLSIYALVEFASFYKLPIHIKDYKGDNTDPVFDNDNYGFKHPTKGWVKFKEGQSKRLADNIAAYYGAADLFHNPSIAIDIPFENIKAGSLIGIQYSDDVYHSQTVRSVFNSEDGKGYETIQGSLHNGAGVPAFRKSYLIEDAKDMGEKSKARQWNFRFFDSKK